MSPTALIENLTSLLQRVQQLFTQSSASPTKMPPFLSTVLHFLLSWRTLFFLLAITNLKSLPLSWHIRLFAGMSRHTAYPHHIRRRLQAAAAALPPPRAISASNPKPVHPIFRPLALPTRSPLGECDYNIHKSNSTYFSDLDISRGNLVASLVGPAIRLNALVPYGVRKGLCYPILGSVHTSFLREIKPYEYYEVRSRMLGWDRKWIVIGSWFVRRATREEVRQDKTSGKNLLKGPVGEEEVVFAYVLNKYVLKAGRLTVPPELALAGSGWFPVRPEATATIRTYHSKKLTNGHLAAPAAATASTTTSQADTGTVTPDQGSEKVIDEAASAVHRVAIEAGRRLSLSMEKNNKDAIKKLVTRDDGDNKEQQIETGGEGEVDGDTPGWTWEEIEEERKRGLKIAEQWLGMDVALRKEYEEDMNRGIRDP